MTRDSHSVGKRRYTVHPTNTIETGGVSRGEPTRYWYAKMYAKRKDFTVCSRSIVILYRVFNTVAVSRKKKHNFSVVILDAVLSELQPNLYHFSG